MRTARAIAATLAAFLAVVLLASPASAATKIVTEASGVDFSQTRTAGHYEFQADGLHVWTDDATSQAKVAGYLSTSMSLGSVAAGAEPVAKWTGTNPGPGFQLAGVTADGHGFILVGEPVYGDKWWISDSYCGTWCAALPIAYAGGGGSAHSATLAQWSDGLPGAKITAIGFSLGSGVKGAGVLASLKIAGVVYTFCKGKPVPSTSATPTTSSPAPTTSTSPTTSKPTSVPTTITSTSTRPGTVTTTVINPAQFSTVPNTSKGVDTGDGSLS